MADILQITTPVAPKEYQMPNRHAQQSVDTATGQVFELGEQNRVVRTNERDDNQYSEQNLKDAVLVNPKSASGTGSPTAALDTVKGLLSTYTIEALKEKGDIDTLNKISAFAEEVILKPENLMRDMINQQESATIFSGKLWDALRQLLKSDSPDMQSAILDFVRAAADNESKDELLGSLSLNFKFLASELAPSKAVSEELMRASEALSGPDAARNFAAIKNTLVQLVNYTGNSLLLDNKTQNLLPLIIHNISRYSSNPASLRESFDTVLNIFDNLGLGDSELKTLADAMGIGDPASQNGEGQTSLLSGLFGGNNAAQQTLSPEAAEALKQEIRTKLENAFDDFVIASKLPQEVKNASIISNDTLNEQSKLEDLTKLLTAGVAGMSQRLDAARLKNTLSGIDPEMGSAAVKLALASVTPNTPQMAKALDSIINSYDKTGDLQSLIDRLGTIINSVDDLDKKIPLAQTLNASLAVLAEKNNSNYNPPTSIDILSDFLLKNINDPSMRSMTSMNQTDMIQTMLTSPGVFNPLMHFFTPMDAFGMRAFAEMWVDRNADKRMTGFDRDITEAEGETSHVFMCFDMENVGYFEMEMFAKGTNLSVMLLCPEGKEAAFSSLKTAVPRIAAGVGYTVGTTIVDTLYKKRDLDTVFPKLTETRGDFNAKA